MAAPAVIRRTKSGITLNVLALFKAIEDGKLTEEDRRTADAVLPGVCDKLANKILELGKRGKVSEAISLILAARFRRAVEHREKLRGSRYHLMPPHDGT